MPSGSRYSGCRVTMLARDVVGSDWREEVVGVTEIHVAVTDGRTRWWKVRLSRTDSDILH